MTSTNSVTVLPDPAVRVTVVNEPDLAFVLPAESVANLMTAVPETLPADHDQGCDEPEGSATADGDDDAPFATVELGYVDHGCESGDGFVAVDYRDVVCEVNSGQVSGSDVLARVRQAIVLAVALFVHDHDHHERSSEDDTATETA